AMKMMNHLEAEFDCEIVSVLVSNGDLVEYGQPLFEMKRN
ncbi:MAG: acetyl-CoA carboxylase biotin carboxyl carrier protein subunit, partial [Treponema sp.]|nr:acetyl-CoA carboxylase biotin carboxyl carrier protein subunit [Treponema sp.]